MGIMKRLSGGSKNRSGLFDPVFTDYGHNDEHQSGGEIVHLVPPGAITAFGGGNANTPDGWLKCNGAAISRSEFAALFEAIGTTWGNGDGATTFNIPDLTGDFLVGAGGGAGNLGNQGGEWDHDHSNGTIAITSDSGGHTHPVAGSSGNAGGHTHTSDGGHSHSSGSLTTGAGNNPASADLAPGVTVNEDQHTHNVSGSTGSVGGHNHGAEAGHSHGGGSYDAGSSGSAHQHAAGNVTGSTGTQNPPYAVVHWIIKT